MDETTPGATTPTPPAAPQPTPSAGPPQPGQRPQDRFFDGLRGIGLRRSQHRMVGGVSAGIAERTGIDVTVVRVLTVVLAIFGGLGILAYGLAWLFLPEPDGRIHAEQLLRGDVSAGAIGAIITSVLSLGSVGGVWNHGPVNVGWHGSGVWGLFWGLSGTALFLGAVAVVLYLVTRGRHTPPGGYPPPYAGPPAPYAGPAGPTAPYAGPAGPTAPYAGPPAPYGTGFANPTTRPTTMTAPVPTPVRPATPRRKPFGAFGALAVAGLAIIGAAVTALIMHNGDYAAKIGVMAWAVALAVIAAALVAGGVVGRRAGIVALFAVIALVGTLAATVVPKLDHLQGAGDRTWRPLTLSVDTVSYGLGAGDATLDLSQLDPAALSTVAPRHVVASVGLGQLTIQVPQGVTVSVYSEVGAGDIALGFGASAAQLGSDGVFVGTDRANGDLNGLSIHRRNVLGAGPVQLYVDAKVGLGQIQIEQV